MANNAVAGMGVGMNPVDASGMFFFSPGDPRAWFLGGAMPYLHDPMFQQAWAASGIGTASSAASAASANLALGASASPGLFDPFASALGLGGFGAMGDPYYGMTAPGGVSQRPGSYIEMMSRDARGELYGPFSNPEFLKFAMERYDGALNTAEFTIRKDRLIGLLERFYGAQGYGVTALYRQYSKEQIDRMAERFIAENQNNYHNANWGSGIKHTLGASAVGAAALGGIGAYASKRAAASAAAQTAAQATAQTAANATATAGRWQRFLLGARNFATTVGGSALQGRRLGLIGAAVGAVVGLTYYLASVRGSQNQYTDTRGVSKEDMALAAQRLGSRQQGPGADLSIRDPRFLAFLNDNMERYNTSWVSAIDGEAVNMSRMKAAAADFNAQYGNMVGRIDVNSPRFSEDYNMLSIANDRQWYDHVVEKADVLAALRGSSMAQENYTPQAGVRY